jgi:hypothetical protein
MFLKRQHGDRRLIWKWRGRNERLGQRVVRPRAHSISVDRLGDVLELLLAAILQANVQLAFDFAVNLLGNQDASRIGYPLQPDSNVDPRRRRVRRPAQR